MEVKSANLMTCALVALLFLPGCVCPHSRPLASAPDFETNYVEECDKPAANFVLHVTYEVEGVHKGTQDLYFRLEPRPTDPERRLEIRLRRGGRFVSHNYNADGISKRTGKGIGCGGSCAVQNVQSDGIVVSFSCYWTSDEGTGDLNHYVIFPYDHTSETRAGRFRVRGKVEWLKR